MADFECPVVRIEEVTPIEGADKIEAVRIGGYRSIVQKDSYKVGDLAVYIPCGSLVPVKIQEELGLVGKLSGKNKDRVKEIKLRGTLSEGLVYPFDRNALQENGFTAIAGEGDDAASSLGIKKYEPAIPAQMAGRVKPYPFTLNYDIENIKKHPNAFERGTLVAISEKVHGTLMQVGLIHQEDGTTFKYVTSKGLGKAGLIIQDVPENENNLYIRTAKKYGLLTKLDHMDEGEDLYILGEVYGQGIQDLSYTEDADPHFRAFDIYEGKKGKGKYLNWADFTMLCQAFDIDTVNYLWTGPFDQKIVDEFTNGKETISGKELHIREGIVIRPWFEEEKRGVGRLILKSVSEAYLLRKGGTEYN